MALTINQAVMNEVRTILLDPNGVYWSDTYLLQAYNIVITALIGENPSALTKQIQFPIAAGVEQVLPSDAVQLIRMPANVVSGLTIEQTTGQAMHHGDPYWYGNPPTTDVRHIIPDEMDPLRFRVWPPNNGNGKVYLSYAYAPDDATSLNDPFGLTEAFRIDVRNGVLGMAYGLNTDRGDIVKSDFYFKQLDAKLASKIQSQLTTQARAGTARSTE